MTTPSFAWRMTTPSFAKQWGCNESLKKGKSVGVNNIPEDHEGTVSIEGRAITNLRFADDIDGLGGEEGELAKLVERLDKASTACCMEINAERTKLMTKNTSGINTEIKVNGQKIETVTRFKYLGSVITDEGSKPEIAYSPG